MIKIAALVWAFAQIGITAFGGGLSTLPLIEYQLVTKNGWMDASGFARMVAISQMTPGPIAVNAATFAGYSEAGVLGSAAATLAIILAPILALTVVLLILKRVPPEKKQTIQTASAPGSSGSSDSFDSFAAYLDAEKRDGGCRAFLGRACSASVYSFFQRVSDSYAYDLRGFWSFFYKVMFYPY